jgi:PKD repeat protein
LLVGGSAAAVLCSSLASPAGAVVVHAPNGHVYGVAPRSGVSPASLLGSVAAQRREGASNPAFDNGNLDYHDGPVLHASAPYLIFWDPGGAVPASSRNLYERYLTDLAVDSGKATDVFGVDRQFTDATGFADEGLTFSTAAQAIDDTDPYPALGGSCVGQTDTTSPFDYPYCVTDSQLQAEVAGVIAADHLPTGIDGSAPVYLVVTPPTVNVCFDSPANQCTSNAFCSYHSSFQDSGATVVYATINEMILGPGFNPKDCQQDNKATVQEPNGDPADVKLKTISHEYDEIITDPTGGGWFDDISGNEDGDNCTFWGATVDPANGANPDAFEPTLGGSAAAGTLYNQLINGDHYYTQSVWSNGDVNCELKPSPGTITPSFAAPSVGVPGATIAFDPTASASSEGYSSVTWSFGDGASSFSAGAAAPAAVTHAYSVPGAYTVTLRLVDTRGNLATVSRQVTIVNDELPTAAFSVPTATPAAGEATSFDGTASTDPDGSVASYSWDFGDGSTAGSGESASHAYATAGTYTVTLTVTDSAGLTASVSRQVTVDEPPTAAFAMITPTPVPRRATAFNASASIDPDGSIGSYSWDFGDGSAPGSGAIASHTYAVPGAYTVMLTVTDSAGLTATTSHQVTVDEFPTAAFSVATATPAAGEATSFDGSASSDPDGSIGSYSWDFGDGSAARLGPAPSHVYSTAGEYTVTLTVTDGAGLTAATSHLLTVDAAPITGFTIVTSHPITVVASARVIGLSTLTNRSGSFLLVRVSGPGELTVNGNRHRIPRAETAKLKLRLTAGQRRQLHRRHKLRLEVKLTFVPTAGSPWEKTEVVTLHS